MARGTRNGAAWGSVVAGVGSVATLPVAIYLTRFSDAYELVHAGLAIPLGLALGAVALALARRAGRRASVLVRGGSRPPAARLGRALGVAGIALAAAGVVALGVYGLLEYVGARE